MGLGRVELPTSRLSGVRSNHLSYRPCCIVFRAVKYRRNCSLLQLDMTGDMGYVSRPRVRHRYKKTSLRSFFFENPGLRNFRVVRLRAFRSTSDLLGYSRKEVIQPQVPLRLPCYDFAPVIELALGRSPLAVRTRTSGTPDFHGVTGGVYKARERIHRGVADPRLLAIPASCGRVAAHNPNLDEVSGIRFTLPLRSPLSSPL